MGSFGAHIAGYKQKAPPERDFSGFVAWFSSFEQRCSDPSPGSKKEKEVPSGS